MIFIEFISAQPSDDCGCPEETWLVGGAELTLHMEPDGRAHALLDGGDWDTETDLPPATHLDAIRADAFDWVASLFGGRAA